METYSDLVLRFGTIRKQVPKNLPLLKELNDQLLQMELSMTAEEIIAGVKKAYIGITQTGHFANTY